MPETARMTGFSVFSAEVLVSSEERQSSIRKRALFALCEENWGMVGGGGARVTHAIVFLYIFIVISVNIK
jgi:hypothetical protein